ncbi:hypothetical protein JCM10213v2_000315 [Rhodosporidiobolus nylandii]
MTSRPVPEHFEEELLNKHFEYTYDNGGKITGGPMNGRNNFQTAYYQRIRPQLWQIGWVEETGTQVTMALDIEQKRITTFMAFSKGHWELPEKAHGSKPAQLEQWRELAKIESDKPSSRHVLPEQANIDKIYDGRGELEDIDMSWPTL